MINNQNQLILMNKIVSIYSNLFLQLVVNHLWHEFYDARRCNIFQSPNKSFSIMFDFYNISQQTLSTNELYFFNRREVKKEKRMGILRYSEKIDGIFRSHSVDLIRSLDTVISSFLATHEMWFSINATLRQNVPEFGNLLAYHPGCSKKVSS